VVKTARLLWEGRDYPLAETAFVSLARPDVAEGLERCRRLSVGQHGAGQHRPGRIVVARYFLFPGVLPDRVTEQAAQYAAAHPELDIAVAGVLGDCDQIAALVLERYREALSGDIRMNCDMCVYRIALPGFEHRVGEPQHPHDHPHDHVHGYA
jgi:sirohydrochlorin cobaltochelatase